MFLVYEVRACDEFEHSLEIAKKQNCVKSEKWKSDFGFNFSFFRCFSLQSTKVLLNVRGSATATSSEVFVPRARKTYKLSELF